MPICFVFGLIGLVILYVTLRLRIAYSVKRFPTYDQKMNRSTIMGMSYLPLVYSIVAAWLYSNE